MRPSGSGPLWSWGAPCPLRAAAVHHPGPVAALTILNQVLHERCGGSDPRYCTVILGTLEPDAASGKVTVRLASGGHPPALVLRADDTADFLTAPDGPLVGILLPTARSSSPRRSSAPGTLFFCTPTA